MSVRYWNGNANEIVEARRKALRGGNGFVLGLPGTGKTTVVKKQIREILEHSEDTVVVLDSDGSFRAFAQALGGLVVPVGGQDGLRINPLELNMVGAFSEDDPVSDKVDFVFALVEGFWGCELSPRQKSVVDRAVRKAYAPFLGSVDVLTGEYDCSLQPTLESLYELLLGCGDEDTTLIAKSLWPFVKVCCEVLGGQMDGRPEGRLIVLDFSECFQHMKSEVMMTVLEYLRSAVVEGGRLARGVDRKLWIYMDDVSLMLGSESAVEYMRTYFKRVRSYGCILTGVTQNVSALLGFDNARAMFSNSDYVHLMRLSRVDRGKIGELFGFQEDAFSGASRYGLVWLSQTV